MRDCVQLVGHSPDCQILLQMMVRMSTTESPPWIRSSAGMLSTPAAFPVFKLRTASATSSRKIGKLSSFVDSCTISTLGSPWLWKLYKSEQYSVHLVLISSSSVRFLPFLSWMVLTLACFFFVKSFTSLKAFLVLLLDIQSSMSWHCFSIQFCFAFFIPFLICLLISVCASLPSAVCLFFFKLLLVSHKSRISFDIHGFDLRWLFPSTSFAVSVITALKLLGIVSESPSRRRSGANLPPSVALKYFAIVGCLSFSRSNFILMFFVLLIFFSLTLKFIITRSWSLNISAPGNVLVFGLLMPDLNLSCTRI